MSICLAHLDYCETRCFQTVWITTLQLSSDDIFSSPLFVVLDLVEALHLLIKSRTHNPKWNSKPQVFSLMYSGGPAICIEARRAVLSAYRPGVRGLILIMTSHSSKMLSCRNTGSRTASCRVVLPLRDEPAALQSVWLQPRTNTVTYYITRCMPSPDA
jgi:hypothetical protein